MKKLLFGLLCFGALYFTLHHSKYGHLIYGYHKFWYTPESYQSDIHFIHQKKCSILKKIHLSKVSGRKKYLEQVRQVVLKDIPKLFDYWYGTRWNLNGMTQTPGHGKIACGYFVTTILRDAGFKVNRIKMAQMAAEPFLKKIVNPNKLKRFYKVDIHQFLEVIKAQGAGLYLVGLDTHIGFIQYEASDKESIWFIHSGSLGQKCVKRERASESRTLNNSKYKVLAKLDDDEKFMRLWLKE